MLREKGCNDNVALQRVVAFARSFKPQEVSLERTGFIMQVCCAVRLSQIGSDRIEEANGMLRFQVCRPCAVPA
jgi:hypothetical protein